MPNLPRRFPCGDFFPGEEPRTPPNQGTSTSIPPIYIPEVPVGEPPFIPPDDPPRIPPVIYPKFACVGESPGDQFARGGKRCLPCNGISFNTEGIAVSIDSADDRCIHSSLADCIIVCREREPSIGDGDGGSGPGGGDAREFKKCVERIVRCDPPDRTRTYTRDELESFPIKQILRTPVDCTFNEATMDYINAGAAGYPFTPDAPYPANPNGKSAADDFCLAMEITIPSFWEGCVNSEIFNCIVEVQPNSVVTQGPSISNSESFVASIINLIPTKQSTQVTISNNNLNRFSSASGSISNGTGLFDETYNFFKTYPSNQANFVPNSQYLNIFNEFVTEEVAYFLRKNNTNSPWHESIINSLTNDKIILSINQNLLVAVNNIHGVGNERVNLSTFISSLKSNLMSGRLDEFDPNYYFYIYNTQRNDALLTVVPQGQTPQGIQFSLATFELSSKSPDYSQYSDLTIRNDYKRMRVLLEDIETNIPTTLIDGTTSSLYLRNSGIPTQQIFSPSAYLNIGDGAGYYISSVDINSVAYPLPTTNELSSSRYLPPFERHIVLRNLGTDAKLRINVSSNQNHEFTQNYNPSADVSPMYFVLDFDKLGDIISPNSVINILSATYRRVTDQEGYNHSRNYSLNTIKVNLDHRDPLIHYARDTSTLSIELDDFNLRAFDENRTPAREKIILRNVPAAIILTPGLGSFHNPFNGRSTVTNYGDSIITRTLNLTPNIDVNNTVQLRPPLDISNVYNSIGTAYHGLYEKFFDQDIHGNIFTYNPSSSIFDKSYFYNGTYSNSQPPSSTREKPIEAKIAIDLVDKLANLAGVQELTYWDVYRRLSINDLGKLSTISPTTFMRKLESGWRNNVPIKYVISRAPLRPSGIPDGVTVPNDNIIINEVDRSI